MRRMLPEALLNSEIATATWLFVGGLFAAAIMMLSGTSNGVAATGGAGSDGCSFTTFVRSEAIFGGRSAAEAAAVDRSSITCVASCGFAEFGALTGAGLFAAVKISAFSTLYR